MSQLSFTFPFEDKYLTQDFIVLPENKKIFDFVSNYNISNLDLPQIFAISGPKFSGKTHLANIWKNKVKAEFISHEELKKNDLLNLIQPGNFYILEDVEKIPDQKILFNLFNIINENKAYLLLTSSLPLNQVNYDFPDIASRFKNIYNLEIKEPSPKLIKMLLIKNFATRQLAVEDQVIEYITKNIDRDFESINKITKLLEIHCFEKKRNITIPLVNEVLKTIRK